MKHKQSKFVLRVNESGIHLVEGKLPNRHQQLWKGESTKGEPIEVCFDKDVGHTYYWNFAFNILEEMI